MRQNQGKPALAYALYMPGAIEALAAVLRYGQIKYSHPSQRDWLVYDDEETLESLSRHMQSFILGNDLDEESGLPEIAHMLFNCAVLCDRFLTNHGHGSFWRLIPEDSSSSSNRPLTVDACDQHPYRRPSGPSPQPSSDGGPGSS